MTSTRDGWDIGITAALESLRPGSQWTINGSDSYSNIQWLEPSVSEGGQTMPTEAELNTEISRLNTEYINKQYQRVRKAKYSEIGEQLDMLYHDMVAGKLDSTGTWFNHVKSVKDSNPKS